MTAGPTERPPASLPPRARFLLPAALPLAIGGFLGYQVAYQASLPGFRALGAVYLAYAIGLLVVIALIVGAGNLLRREGRGRAAARLAFGAAGLLVAGGGGGYAAVPLLDLGYHEPVELLSRGDASARLDEAAFSARDGGTADCRSVPNGTAVAEIVALDLGELGTGTLRARVYLPSPVSGEALAFLELWIDGADLPEGYLLQPWWDGEGTAVALSGDASSGRVTFNALPLRVLDALGLPVGPPPGDWPETLSGEVAWACDPWLDPAATVKTAVPAAVTLRLEDADWVASDTDGLGTCEFEADGSVWVVTTEQAGRLHDRPMTVSLDLGGEQRAGTEVHLNLAVNTEAVGTATPGVALAATKGRTITWEELVELAEVAADGSSGRAHFVDLPFGGEEVQGWPATLSGEISWACG